MRFCKSFVTLKASIRQVFAMSISGTAATSTPQR
jgi:hypothetical protein